MTRLVRNHSHWGSFFAEVEDGRVVGVRPFERDPDPSPLIEAIPAAVHSKTRVAQPVVREGWLKNGPASREGRGREPFVPVSWDRALDLIAGELSRVKRDHGHAAIMAGSQGWGSAGIFHEPRPQLRRFMGIFGGYVDQVSNYSFGTALVFLPHVVGNAQCCTGPLTSWSSIARHGRLMVMFGGANPKNMQVTKGGMGVHAIGHSLAELARGGVEVVNISPIRDDGPDAVAPEWISIRPGTDTAMLLALTHTLITEGRHDQEFLARYCTGFERVQSYVMGEADGQPKDADWAAAITGVSAETIRTLARRMAANRTMISASWSLQRADHGEQPYWAVLLLASCLGQIGLPGGGFGFGYGSASGIAEPPPAFRTPGMEAAPNPLNRSIPAARISQCLLHPGEPYDFNGRRSNYPDIRLVYWAGGNPFHHHQDTNQLRAAFRRPETIIVHEPCGPRRRGTLTSCCRRRRRWKEMTSARRSVIRSLSPWKRRSSRSVRRAMIIRSSPRCRSALVARKRLLKGATRWRGCGISITVGATVCAPTLRRYRISTGSGLTVIWKFRKALTNMSCSTNFVPIRMRIS